MKNVSLFIGSVDGAAEHAGFELAESLQSDGYIVDVNVKPKLNDLLSVESQLLVIITSTTGEGELPRNIHPLWRKLYTKKPSLSGVRYAISVLGDSSYGEAFCQGGIELSELLEELGAEKVTPTLLTDMEETTFPEDDIVPWGVETIKNWP